MTATTATTATTAAAVVSLGNTRARDAPLPR
jgi:hypothetical protein